MTRPSTYNFTVVFTILGFLMCACLEQQGATEAAPETISATQPKGEQVISPLKQEPAPQPPPNPLPLPRPTGVVLFQSNFESPPKGKSARLNFQPYKDFKAELVELGSEAESNKALIIAGAEGQQHAWKPLIEFRFKSQCNSLIRISFDFFQASYDAGSLNLQASDAEGKYRVHQTMRIANDFIDQGPGNRNKLFTKSLTAGSDAKWQRFVWQLPAPGGEQFDMKVGLDGNLSSGMRHKKNSEGQINSLRLFLQLRRNADIVYYIDNVLIESVSVNESS